MNPNPVRMLRGATQRLAGGDVSVRVGPSQGNRRDETAELGRVFDRVAERIGGLLASQRRLLRDISHELRSPLARLNVAIGLARQKTAPEQQGTLDRMEREAERLNDLIGELLRRAIENVVRNAARFTAEGTDVEVRLSRSEGVSGPTARISVRDHGPGVPEESLDRLFEPFCRVADARDRQSGGTGIGLARPRRAVKLHGGGRSVSPISQEAARRSSSNCHVDRADIAPARLARSRHGLTAGPAPSMMAGVADSWNTLSIDGGTQRWK